MKLGAVLVAVVLGGSVLVACGDDDDSEPLSKSEFIAKGDAICSKSNARFQKLIESEFPTTPGAIPAFFEKALVPTRDAVNGLRALEEPEADKARVERLLATGDRAVADFERATKDPKYGAKLFNEEGGKNSSEFDKQAKAYGFKKCGADEEEGEGEQEEPAVNPSTFPPEKKAYIAKADTVCRESEARFSALEQRYLKSFPPPLRTWAEFLPEVSKEARAQLADLEKIPPPEADRAAIEQLLTRQKEVVTQFDKAGQAAASADEQAFQRLSRKMFATSEELDADLRAYGFQECGKEDE